MAVSGFLQLLNHLDVKGMKVLSSSQSSQLSQHSQGQPPARSLLTQVTFQLLQITRIKLNKLDQVIKLLTCIWKVLALNLGWGTYNRTGIPCSFSQF
jgi:hypothetical protein